MKTVKNKVGQENTKILRGVFFILHFFIFSFLATIVTDIAFRSSELLFLKVVVPGTIKHWSISYKLDNFLPWIDDFGVSDAIDEIFVRGCKVNFGPPELHENPWKSRKYPP